MFVIAHLIVVGKCINMTDITARFRAQIHAQNVAMMVPVYLNSAIVENQSARTVSNASHIIARNVIRASAVLPNHRVIA